MKCPSSYGHHHVEQRKRKLCISVCVSRMACYCRDTKTSDKPTYFLCCVGCKHAHIENTRAKKRGDFLPCPLLPKNTGRSWRRKDCIGDFAMHQHITTNSIFLSNKSSGRGSTLADSAVCFFSLLMMLCTLCVYAVRHYAGNQNPDINVMDNE